MTLYEQELIGLLSIKYICHNMIDQFYCVVSQYHGADSW